MKEKKLPISRRDFLKIIPLSLFGIAGEVVPTMKNIIKFGEMFAEQKVALLTQEEIDFLSEHPINHGETRKKQIMMTYDEGIRPENVEHLLDVYKKAGAKCTFFMRGDGLIESREFIHRLIDEGHELGSHGDSPEHLNLALFSEVDLIDQFQKWLSKVYSIVPQYNPTHFRAPYGSYNQRVLETAASFGLQHVLWNVESGGEVETTMDNVFKNFQLFQNYYDAVGGAIVLSHTHRRFDISQSEAIVNKWLELGYELVTISEGKKESDTWKPYDTIYNTNTKKDMMAME